MHKLILKYVTFTKKLIHIGGNKIESNLRN